MDESNNPCEDNLLENGDVNASVENASYVETSFSTVLEHRKLKVDLENCKQESHLLRRKFELQEAMLKDLQTANESLERQLSNKSSTKNNALRELEEQYRANRERYEDRIASLETTLSKKVSENEELQELLAKQREETAAAAAIEQSIVTDNDPTVFEQEIKLLMQQLQEEANLRQDAEKTAEDLKTQYSELQSVLEATREHLRENKETVESLREELALLRLEMNTPKPVLDEGSSKGNSLFAEVEDRRKQTSDKFAALKSKYLEAKQMYKIKTDEIKMLRAERTVMLRKWENDFVGCQADNEELIGKYKSRIADLENKLKAEIKKNRESQEPKTVDPSYEYFQLLLTSKKREVENLQVKIEDLTTKLLIKEDAKLNTEKQLRFWKYKATSLEAQALLSKTTQQNSPETANIKTEEAGRDILSPIENKSSKCVTDNVEDCSNNDMVGLKKSLRFAEDTKDNVKDKGCLKRTKNTQEYPMIFIPS